MCIRRDIFWITGLTLICLLVFVANGFSDSGNTDTRLRQYRAVRPLGMAEAFAAIADDGDAFYYNPAGLANIRKLRIDLQPIKLIPTQDFYDEMRDLEQLIDDIEAINESEEPLEDPNLEDERRRLIDRMERLSQDNLGLDAAAPARIIVPLHVGDYSLAIGGIIHGWSESQVYIRRRGLKWADFVKDILDDEVVYNIMAETSYGGAAAIEVPIQPLPLELSFGLSARRIYRWQMDDEDDPLGIEDLISPDGKDGIEGTADDFTERYFDPEDPWDSVLKGKGYSMDIGTIASFDDIFSLAVVLQNLVGKIEYEEEEDEEIPQNLGISAALNLAKLATPDIPTLDIILAAGLDKNDETWDTDEFIDKTRLGLEIIWSLPSIALSGRIGSNHGYLTLGTGVQLFFLDLDYAFFADQGTNWHAFSLNLAF